MSPKPQLTKEEDVWVIRLSKDNGRQQVYRCASESQARALLLVLAPSSEKEDAPSGPGPGPSAAA